MFVYHLTGWYSTGCYYWAKSIEELIPTVITTFLYVYIIDIYEEKSIFMFYLLFLTIGILCLQSVGHIIGIIFNENQKIAVLSSVALYLMFFLLTNYFVPIKELHYSLQWLSNLSTFKSLFECILILFYGFSRCSGNEFSTVMFVFGFNDNQFYVNLRILLIKLIVFRVLALLVLLIKVHSSVSHKTHSSSDDDSCEQQSISDSNDESSYVRESKIFMPWA